MQIRKQPTIITEEDSKKALLKQERVIIRIWGPNHISIGTETLNYYFSLRSGKLVRNDKKPIRNFEEDLAYEEKNSTFEKGYSPKLVYCFYKLDFSSVVYYLQSLEGKIESAQNAALLALCQGKLVTEEMLSKLKIKYDDNVLYPHRTIEKIKEIPFEKFLAIAKQIELEREPLTAKISFESETLPVQQKKSWCCLFSKAIPFVAGGVVIATSYIAYSYRK